MILCSCKAVRQQEVLNQLPKLNPCLPLADLSAKTGAATDCGTCHRDVETLVARYEGAEANRTAAENIHADGRNVLVYSDFEDALPPVLSHHAERIYPVISIVGGLDEAQTMAPSLGAVNLFALALDHGRMLFMNHAGLPSDRWIASLSEGDAFPAWTQINQGRFRKWNPDKIDRKALLRFLVSEIEFIRGALNVAPLKTVVSTGPYGSDFFSFPDRVGGIPHHRILAGENTPVPPTSARIPERSLILSAGSLAQGFEDLMRSIDSAS